MTQELTDAEDVLALMAEGKELRNRGTGWWLAFPRKPYDAFTGEKVSDELVSQLEKDRRIKITIPGTTAIAELTGQS